MWRQGNGRGALRAGATWCMCLRLCLCLCLRPHAYVYVCLCVSGAGADAQHYVGGGARGEGSAGDPGQIFAGLPCCGWLGVGRRYYTVPAAGSTSPPYNRVVRVTAAGDVAQPGSLVQLFRLENLGAGNHNGARRGDPPTHPTTTRTRSLTPAPSP